jgi:hypothetical protein
MWRVAQLNNRRIGTMKNICSRTSTALASGALILFGGLAAAQEEITQDEAAPIPPADVVITEQSPDEKLSDDLIGLPVVAQQDGEEQQVGSVDALLFDADDGIAGVVIQIGGFLGFGAKQVALSYGEVQLQEMEGRPVAAMVGMTREQLENAPDFKTQATLEAERQQEQLEQQQLMQQQQAPLQ